MHIVTEIEDMVKYNDANAYKNNLGVLLCLKQDY